MSRTKSKMPAASAAHRFGRALKNRLLFLAAGNAVLLTYILAYTSLHEQASFRDEMSRLGPNVAPLILAGMGLTGIVMTGAIDLSIGAIVVVAGTVLGILYQRGAPPAVCFVACFVTAALLSAGNGYLIRWLKIPAIIVTLAGLTFYRGVALVLADLCLPDFAGQISFRGDVYHAPGRDYAVWILVMTVVAAVVWELHGKTVRTWLALGSSREACLLKGMRPDHILQSAFSVGGLFLGLAALTEVTNSLTIEPSRMARGFELEVIGAVVLGGTNIFGGEGSLAGTALGGVFLYLINQAMLYAGVSEFWRTSLEGAMIIGVIGFDCAMHRKQKLLDELT